MSTPLPPLPQPLQIPADLISLPNSITIPLHAIPLGQATADQPANYKFGLMVQATVDGHASDPQLFEFDTGGQGFWMQPSGQIPTPDLGDCTLQITYTSGIVYRAKPADATLTFPEANAALAAKAIVGLIGDIEGRSFPIFGAFYGDFGAALQGFVPTNAQQGAGGYDPNNPALLTVLSQLPNQYASGFIVDLGGYPGFPTSRPPRLIVGLTDALRAKFPNTLPMTPSAPYFGTGVPLRCWAETLVTGTLSVNGTATAQPIDVVFDTGAPDTMIHTGSLVDDKFVPKQNDLVGLVPSANTNFSLLNFKVGMPPNSAGSASQSALNIAAGYVNTGLNPFYSFPIMFDLQNGLVRFPALSNS